MAGGGRQAHTRRARQASLGFFPLQRMRSRRSTNPGFPRPGPFPSQRFSRSQGFAPSKTLAGLFHPANAHGVPPKERPQTSGSRGTRVVKIPQEAQFRRAEQPGPAQPEHPKAHGRTGQWNLSGRDSVFGAQERGVKPSTRDDDHRRVEPQVILSPLNSGKPEPPIPPSCGPEGLQPEKPAGEKARTARLRFSPKARDRTPPPRPFSQQRRRTSPARGKPRSFLARPALSKQANSLERARCVERAQSSPDDLDTIRPSETQRGASPSWRLSRSRPSSHDGEQAPRDSSRDVAAEPTQGQQDRRTEPGEDSG
jgi:hypothetical protein